MSIKLFPLNFRSRFTGDIFLEFLACMTLGHLCFLPIWEFAAGGSPRLFLLDESLGLTIFLPLFTITSLLCLVGMFALHLRHKKTRTLGNLLWIVLVFFAFFSLCRTAIYGYLSKFHLVASSTGTKITIMVFCVLFLILTMAISNVNQWITSSRRILTIISPFILIVWVQTLNFLNSKPFTLHANPSLVKSTSSPIFILIFDELDGKISIDEPPQNTGMYEFDFWKTFSIHATHAFPPAGGTLWSVPAMIQGQQISNQPIGVDYINSWQALAKIGKSKQWNWSDNIFNDIAQQQGKSELIVWQGFPYQPIYSNSVNDLWFLTEKVQSITTNTNPSFLSLLHMINLEILFGPFRAIHSSPSNAHVQILGKINNRINNLLKNPPPSLVWIHYPVPHWPPIKRGGSYSDNLLSADRELRLFRETMQKKGWWDDSTIFVMSDHWFRKPIYLSSEKCDEFIVGFKDRWNSKDHRVPFLLKLAHQKNGLMHKQGFNTIILRALVAAIRRAEVDTPEKVSIWLDRNSPFAESPTTLPLP